MKKYSLDTNIITALIKGDESVKRRFQLEISQGNECFIDGLCYYETLRGLLEIAADEKIRILNSLFQKDKIVLLDDPAIFDESSKIWVGLRKKGTPIKDADILIASVVLIKGLILVSDNTKHFEQIKQVANKPLQLENWIQRN